MAIREGQPVDGVWGEWLELEPESLMSDLPLLPTGMTGPVPGAASEKPPPPELIFTELFPAPTDDASNSSTGGPSAPSSLPEMPLPPQPPLRTGPFDRQPTTSLDAFLASQLLDEPGRAFSLPTLATTDSSGAQCPSSSIGRSLSWTAPPQAPAVGGLRGGLLQAMPMGRAAGTNMDRARAKADAESEAAHRLKNRDAQRRFRQRQRDTISGAQKAVEELTRKLRDLSWDVQQERVNAKVIMESLFLEDIHIKRLASLPKVRAAEQEAMLDCFQSIINRIGRTDDVRQWRVKDWIEWFGTDYIPRLKELIMKHNSDPRAAQLLQELIYLRRENLARIARFSSWAWILYAWNLEACRSVPAHQRPGLEKCAQILVALQLSRAQEDKLLRAHRRLREQLSIAASERCQVVAALEASEDLGSLEAISRPAAEPGSGSSHDLLGKADSTTSLESSGSQDSGKTHYGGFQVEGVDWGPAGPALRALRRGLEGERWAVFNFLFTAMDEVLTPEQEAVLETLAYPFQPNWHAVLCILDLQRRHKPVTPEAVKALALPDLSVASPRIMPLMPTVTASQLLQQPLTVLGMGARLAYGIALNPYQTVDDASLWRLPSCSATSTMRIHDAVSGSWQIGIGAPLYWFGLNAEDQDPYSLEPHDKARLRHQLQQKLGLLKR